MTGFCTRHANRDIEWMVSTLLVGLGLGIALLPDVFASPSFRGFAGRGIDEDPFGIGVMVIGATWMVGLWINGSWRRSPLLRLACALVGTTIWSALEAGFIFSTASPSILTYGVITAFSLIACARCGHDAAKAIRKSRRGNGNAELGS